MNRSARVISKLKSLFRAPCIHEYRATWHGDGRSERIVTQGDVEFVERYLSQKELLQLFGGFIRSRNPKDGHEFLGVWGRRESSRFRRLLRERGARFEIRRTAPFARPKVIATVGKAIRTDPY